MSRGYTTKWLDTSLKKRLQAQNSKLPLIVNSIALNPNHKYSTTTQQSYNGLPTRIYAVTDEHCGSISITYAVDETQKIVHILMVTQNGIEL